MEQYFDIMESNALGGDNRAFTNNLPIEETNDENIIEQIIFEMENQNPKDNPSVTEETSFKLKEPPDIEEILTIDKALIPATSHNVSVINSACQQVLKEMEHQLLTLLKKNRKEQEIVQHYIASNGKSPDFENTKTRTLKIAGMPYFKDRHGFIPPPNEDVLRKKMNKKLLPTDFIQTSPVWNPTDVKTLTKAVSKCEVLENSGIDWLKISATDMEGKYSPAECKSMWTMNLKPDVNKSKWGLKENKSLQVIAAKNNFQDWDKIAEELGTGRTALQCCIQYQTHKCPSEGKWSKEEDENLKKLVEKYKIKDFIPWTKVVWHFQHRSLKQCQERYAYHLGNIKKGSFSMEEDFVIVYLASKLKNFGEVAKFLPNRVATQVRARYEYLVQLSMPAFTKEEDELLSKLMVQYPKNWAKISEHFENRSKVQCRRRWGYLQRGIKVENDFGSEEDEEENFPHASGDNQNKNTSDVAMVKKNLHILSKPAQVGKKLPETYNKLIEHYEHCYKFLFGPRPRTLTNAEESKRLLTKLKITMKSLSVCESPVGDNIDLSALSSNCEFEKEDLNALENLKSGEGSRQMALSVKIIPPNFMTLVGLRTILMIWSKIKNFTNGVTSKTSIDSNSNDRILFGEAKTLFKTRMKALFAFPLLLSNIPPSEDSKPVYKPKVRKNVKPLSKLKRKRHAKYMSEAYRKKLEKSLSEKLSEPGEDEAEKSSAAVPDRKKRKYTRRSKKPEVNGESVRASKRRRSPRTTENESSDGKKLAMYKMFKD